MWFKKLFTKKQNRNGIFNTFDDALQKFVCKVIDEYSCDSRPSILDIGSGKQCITSILKKGASYTALDLKEEKGNVPQGVTYNFVKGKFLDEEVLLKLQNNRFDIIVISRVHIEDGEYDSFYNKAFRILKPHGVLVLVGYTGVHDDLTQILGSALGISVVYADDVERSILQACEALEYKDIMRSVDISCQLFFSNDLELVTYLTQLQRRVIVKKYGLNIADIGNAYNSVREKIEGECEVIKNEIGLYVENNKSFINSPLRQIYKARIVKRS